MDAHEPGHPDESLAPVVTGDTRIRDTASGDVRTADAWVEQRMASEGRERQECLDELVNAVARGDLVVENAPQTS
jgi:hypothetical protein